MSVTWPGGIIHTLEISFTTDPLATSVWTDVSAYLMDIPQIFHGQTSEDGDVSPSTMSVVLKNKDRRFDPDYTSSPYSPNVLPMKAIRYRIQLGAFTKTLFTGYVQGWPQRWNRRFFGTTQIQAISGNRLINNSTLPPSAYNVEVLADTPAGYWALQGVDFEAAVGADLMQSDVFGGPLDLSAVHLGWPLGAPTGIHLDQFDRLNGTLSVSAVAALETWVSVEAGADNATIIILGYIASTTWMRLVVDPDGDVFVGYSHAANNLFDNISAAVANTGIGIHHVALLRDGGNLRLIVDGATVAVVALAAGTEATTFVTPVVGLNISVNNAIGVDGLTGGLSHVALYETAPSVARFDAHHQVGRYAWTGAHGEYGYEYGGARINRILDDLVEGAWPAALRDIDAGQTLHGPYLPDNGNALDAIRDVVRAECGVLVLNTEGKLTFIDRQTLWTTADTGTIFSDDGSPAAAEYSDFTPEGNTVETIRNIVTTSYSTVGAITRRDQTSIDSYGASNQSDTCPTLPSADVASLRSAYILREKKDPHTRITQLTCLLRGPVGMVAIAAQVGKVLALEIGTIITVEHTPMGLGSQTVKKVMVLGIRHQISRKPMQWTTTLYLSPPPTSADDTPYLTLGDATFGQIGAADGNLISY